MNVDFDPANYNKTALDAFIPGAHRGRLESILDFYARLSSQETQRQPWPLKASINSRKLPGVRTHGIGVTHRGRTGHWTSIDEAVRGRALIYASFTINTETRVNY